MLLRISYHSNDLKGSQAVGLRSSRKTDTDKTSRLSVAIKV